MKIGRTLVELAQEVQRQQEAKRDYVASARNMSMVGAYNADNSQLLEPQLQLGDTLQLGIKPIAHQQIAQYTHIPTAYYDKMRTEAPQLLADNVNTWFQRDTNKRMVRTLDGSARAFLSDSYRPLDNADFIEAALPPLIDMGVEVISCDVTDSRLYLKVVDKRIMVDIPKGYKLGDGSHKFFDTASPALVLSNSEVGYGALAVQTSIFTHMCTNLAVVSERSTRKYHLGTKADIGEQVYALLSSDTRAATDKALWMQIKDVVRAAFDRAQFDAVCDKLREAGEDKITGDVVKVVDVTVKKYQLSDGERNSILTHLVTGGDLSRYGLHAAVTRTAEDLVSYDRASEFEKLGGKIIELRPHEWQEMAMAA